LPERWWLPPGPARPDVERRPMTDATTRAKRTA
jgi:hypothetical protein